MWFCTSGTNAFDKLGIWEFGNLEGGRGGRGRRGGGKYGMNRVGDKLNLCSYLFYCQIFLKLFLGSSSSNHCKDRKVRI